MNQTDWNPQFYKDSLIFEPVSGYVAKLGQQNDWPTCHGLNVLKNNSEGNIVNSRGLPINFVPHEKINTAVAFEQQYEPRIYLKGEVPTREENWHDFFNALVWITFPKAKAALNQMHYQVLKQLKPEQSSSVSASPRGPLRDAATLLDESGVVVLSSQPEWITLLRQHEWKRVFWKQRASVLSTLRIIVFGHALYEKVLQPYVGMTGKGVFFQVEPDFFQQTITSQVETVDQWLADFVSRKLSSSADLSPVPILGYPGWSEDNVNEAYYDNRNYFRPFPSG